MMRAKGFAWVMAASSCSPPTCGEDVSFGEVNTRLGGWQTYVLVVDVNALRGKSLQSLEGLLLLVVEATVESEVLGNELQLLVVANAANDLQALVLGELANKLTDSSRSSRHEDRLALLRFSNGVERAVRGQTRHTQCADEELGVKLVWVLQNLEAVRLLLADSNVLLGVRSRGVNEVSRLELLVVALDHGDDGRVGDWLAEIEWRSVALDFRSPHAATLVWVEGDIVNLDGDTALWRSLLGVEVAAFDLEVLASLGPAGWDLSEDEGLVLNHLV